MIELSTLKFRVYYQGRETKILTYDEMTWLTSNLREIKCPYGVAVVQ